MFGWKDFGRKEREGKEIRGKRLNFSYLVRRKNGEGKVK